MKKILIVIAFSFSSLLTAGLDDANKLLKAAEYDSAIVLYESLAEQGFIGHELFFNMGITYKKLNDIPHAILYFEKALRLRPNHKATVAQLVNLKLTLRDKPPVFRRSKLNDWIDTIKYTLPIDVWAFVSLVFMLAFAIGIAITYLKRKTRWRKVMLLILPASFLLSWLCFFSAYTMHQRLKHPTAVIMASTLNVYESAKIGGAILFTLHEGSTVDVLKEENGMYQIRYFDKTGWIVLKETQRVDL